jgi:hypothetical protein
MSCSDYNGRMGVIGGFCLLVLFPACKDEGKISESTSEAAGS